MPEPTPSITTATVWTGRCYGCNQYFQHLPYGGVLLTLPFGAPAVRAIQVRLCAGCRDELAGAAGPRKLFNMTER